VKQEQSYYPERVKRAAHLLFFKRGRVPGARSWELKTGLGKEYLKVLTQLDESLKDLDLEVKKVESQVLSDYKPGPDGEEESRYFVRLKGTLTPREARMTGWRIDNLAALAACLSLIVSKQGKSERKELEEIIGQKVGRWRALTLTDAFLRSGYLEEDEEGLVKLGWRTRAELALESLMTLIAESKPKGLIDQETPETTRASEPEDVSGVVEAAELEEDQASTDA
jgi:hypothetical protein